jgi:hypothetical protein
VAQVIVFVNKIGSYVHNATQANYGAPEMRAVLLRTNGVFFSARPSRRGSGSAVHAVCCGTSCEGRAQRSAHALRALPPCTGAPNKNIGDAFLLVWVQVSRCPAAAHCVPHPAGVSAVPPSNWAVGWLRC